MTILLGFLKLIAAGVTAFFGGYGLLHDFRREGRVTREGKIALYGGIIAGLLTLAAQVLETIKQRQDDQKADLKSAQQAQVNTQLMTQTLTVVHNTSDAVRLMSSLAGATVDVTYSVDCVAPRIHSCANLSKMENLLAKVEIPVFLYADPAKAKLLTDGVSDHADLRWELRRETAADEYTFGEGGYGVDPVFQLTVRGYKITPINSETVEDQIWTISDLPGKTILIDGGTIRSNDVTIKTIKIRMWDGESKVAGPFQKIPQPPNSNFLVGTGSQVVYRYVFPKRGTSSN
jgi:hypothetical protein